MNWLPMLFDRFAHVGVLGVGRRVERVRGDVAEAAAHPHAERADGVRAGRVRRPSSVSE